MIKRRFMALAAALGMLGSVTIVQATTEPQVRAQVVLANCAPIPNLTELRHQTKGGVEIVTTLSPDIKFVCHMDVVVAGEKKILLTIPVTHYPDPGEVLRFDITTYQNHSF